MSLAQETAQAPVLLRRDEAGIATLTLNRPASGNSLSHALVHALHAALDDIKRDETVRVVVLAASGRLFCTGHDLNETLACNRAEDKRAANAACSQMMLDLVNLPKPTIAKVQGVATAAGCELAASCDLVVASRTARFATPGVNIGMWCHTPQVAVSRAMPAKHALHMLLTGKLFDAEAAYRMGLVSEVVPPEELDERVSELALLLAGKSAYALALGKESFRRQAQLDRAAAYEVACDYVYRNFQAEDCREGIAAFLEKRKPVWKGR
jgi:enoyl-CoA hydratase/carnithine racemase